MTDRAALSELADFVTHAEDGRNAAPRRSRTAIALGSAHPQRRSVGDLLGAVLVLSARTRRMAQPAVQIELDVFDPTGRRAITFVQPRTHS